MSQEIPQNCIRYEVYPEAVYNNASHIVSCSSNRNTVQRLITAFAKGDPLSGSLYPLIQDVTRGDIPSKRAQLSKVAKHYRDHASALKREDAQLQEDIMEIMVRLAQVRADIAEAENRLDLACNSMSPIRLLPSELLEVVFLEVVGGTDRDEWTPAKSSPQTAISQVCGNWRRISLQLPHLWNRFLFDIGIPLHSSRHPRQSLLYLKQWVERSNPLPFSICLRTNTHFPHPSDGPYYHTILESIADRAGSRIELLRVHSDNPILLESTAWSRFVSTKCLELVGTRDIAGRITLPCHSFNQLPSLASVHYDVSPASPFLFPVSFASLTGIEVGDSNEGVDAYALRYLLRCCPKLKRGRFFMATNGGRGGFILNGFVSANAIRDINPNDNCTLEELECLALNGQYFLLQTVLRGLQTPKLQSLELRLRETIVNDPILESWKDTFESLKSLRMLSISCGSIENLDEFNGCLSLLDQLQHLKYQAQYDSKVFRMLKVDEDATKAPLLPKLTRLSTWVWGMKSGERKDFWDMFHSRSKRAMQFGSSGDAPSGVGQFVVDAFIDRTKLYSADVPNALRAEHPKAKDTIRFHIVSPFTQM